MTARIGIVVLSWNGGAQTRACIESVRAQAYTEKFIVLVDNNSARREREQLRDRYGAAPDVVLQLLDENRGYAGGNNAGMMTALARGADAVLILTQDATLAPDALAAMARVLGSDSRIGIVGPQVRDARRPAHVLSAGERVHVALLCIPRTLLRYRRPRFAWYEVGGVWGCAMLLSRQCVETVGGFDEDLFAYYEEVDLCLRVRARGFSVVCLPGAVVLHDGMRGFRGGLTPLSAELKARNLLNLARKWAAPVHWSVVIPTYALLLVASALLYAVRGRADIVRALGRGVAAGVRGQGGPPAAALAEAVGRGAEENAAPGPGQPRPL